MTNLRIGHGFDVHRLVPGRKLIIGGVEIPYERGLDGHSDADVLLHAVMDALLGAASLPDIGQQFPPSDESYRGADSMNLLSTVVSLIKKAGVEGIVNIDAVIMAESPKMNPHIQQMIVNIARVLAISQGRVNIKATTTEKLGYVGRGEGIAASAVCLLEKDA